MYDNDSKGISYTAGFFMLLAFAIAGLTLAALTGAAVWTKMTGLGTAELINGVGNPAYSNIYKVVQVINETIGYFMPAVLTALMLNRKPMRLLGFTGPINAKQWGLVVLIVGVSLLVGSALSYFNHIIPIPADWKLKFDEKEAGYMRQVKGILGLKNFGDYLIALVVMAFVPAVCEETLFRGGLQNFLARSTNRPWIAIIFVSLLFSAAHDSFYGFLFRFFLGAVLGFIYQYSGRLWLAIFAHFINNALTVTVYYLYIQQGKTPEDAMTSTTGSWWTILALPIVISLFAVFRKVSPKTRAI
jgi:uncharacterized protein